MADALYNSAAVYDLPLTKGDDLALRFVYCELHVDENGDPILDGKGRAQFEVKDYPEGAAVRLEIDTRPDQLVIDAVIDGHDAMIHAPAEVVDKVPGRIAYRVKSILSPDLAKVPTHGKTVRND